MLSVINDMTSNARPALASQTQVSYEAEAHRRGCKCRRSKCLKKYCECFQNGVACTDLCKCTGCANRGGAGKGPDAPAPKQVRVGGGGEAQLDVRGRGGRSEVQSCV